jgi:hypothetical protein
MSSNNSNGNNKPEIPIPDGEAEKIVEAFKTDLPSFCLHWFRDMSQIDFIPVDGSGNRIESADQKVLDKARSFKMIDKRQQKPGDKTLYDLYVHIMMACMYTRLHRGNSKVRGDTDKYTVKDENAVLSATFNNRPWDRKDRNKRGKSAIAEAQFEIMRRVGLFALNWYLEHQPGRLDPAALKKCKSIKEEFKANQAKLESKKAAFAQKREKLLKSDMADVVHDMEVEIAKLEEQTGSLDEALYHGLTELNLFKAFKDTKPAMDKYEGELITGKVETPLYRLATDEEKKTYLPNKEFKARMVVPAGESEKWRCPQIIDKGELIFDPSFVKIYKEQGLIYNMDPWRQSDGKIIPHTALVAGWDEEKKKATPPKISGAVLCPKCIIRVNPKGGKDKNVFTVKLAFARGGHIFIRAWQPMGQQQQVYEDTPMVDASTGEAVAEFKFSKPLPGASSYDAVFWTKKDQDGGGGGNSNNSNSADLYRPYDNKPVTPSNNEASMGEWTIQHQEDLKAQREMESADQAMAAIMAQSGPLEHDETAMMEPPVVLTKTAGGAGKGEKRKAEGEPEGGVSKRGGGGGKKQKLT